MQVFNAEDVHTLLDYASLIPALDEHHKRDVDDVRSLVLEQPSGTSTAHFLTLPAWQKGRAIGAKLVTVFPENEHNGSGLPSIQAAYVLFDGGNGRPAALIDGTALTLRKTAADSALGARYLARMDAGRMLMVGAGALGPHLIEAHRTVRPGLNHVEIWNRTPARAERLAERLSGQGFKVTATTDLEGAARGADVISCATMASAPLIKGAWLREGAHLDLVGSYRADMHECDEDVFRRASVFTDSPWSAVADSGEIVSALASGALAKEAILANLFDFARGSHSGRRSADEITAFKNGGGGHLDLMVAQHLISADAG